MIEFITDVIARFGGRYFGSNEEKEAQFYVKDMLKKYCDKVEVIPFESALEAHFQSLKLFSLMYVLSLVVFHFNVALAAFIAITNSVLYLGHFVTYRHWLDFLWKEKTSYNVIGDIEPSGEVRSTIIVAGHIDSVKEFKWWFKLKNTGMVLSVMAGFLFPLLAIFLLVATLVSGGWALYVWSFFVLLSPVLIVYYNMHGDEVVHGANDNLTGVATAVEMAKVFCKDRLKHTRVRCISFGSEEAGLRGAYAYAKKHKEQLLDEKAFLLNIDTIKDLEFLTIVTRETNTLTTFDPVVISQMEQSFDAVGVPVKKVPIDVGASDASAFRMLGLSALTIIGMRTDTLDPTYHTRLDNLEHLDGKAMEALKKVLVHFIRKRDANHS